MNRQKKEPKKSPEEIEALKRLGAAMRAAREDVELTQEQVAEKVGVDDNTVSRWEIGEFKPRGDKMELYAQAVGRPAKYFWDIYSARLPYLQEPKRRRDAFETYLATLPPAQQEALRLLMPGGQVPLWLQDELDRRAEALRKRLEDREDNGQ